MVLLLKISQKYMYSYEIFVISNEKKYIN